MRVLKMILIMGLIVGAAYPKTPKELSLVQVSADDSPAVLQLVYWGEDGRDPSAFNVDGTGFLVGREGYFVTAGHVLRRYKANTGQMTVVLRQREGGGNGHWFEVVESDTEHDLALCKMLAYKPGNEKHGGARLPGTYTPIVSLPVTTTEPRVGELLAMIGFPLGSFQTPIVQMGNIAATNARLPSITFASLRGELLIVSAAGNHGNSGCPLISLESGAVLGMVVQYVPAPLFSVMEGGTQREVPQQSGLMVAVPAKWIIDLLARHGIANTPIRPEEKLVM